jgi:hypothetical protein
MEEDIIRIEYDDEIWDVIDAISAALDKYDLRIEQCKEQDEEPNGVTKYQIIQLLRI